MAGNLFFLRGWAISLIAGVLALSTKDINSGYILIAYFLVFIFWILDGYFLSQERLFRDLYNDVRKLNEDEVDFSMDIRKYKEYCRNSWIRCMFSLTLFWFYVPILVSIIIFNNLI